MVKSPFKFLDSFDKQDRDVFFGRDKEVMQLYDSVNKNRVVLVYGQSGTGKTSIIQCGLANEFDVTDWKPYYIRRENDLNLSLQQKLHADVKIAEHVYVDSQNKTTPDVTDAEIHLNKEELFISGIVKCLQNITEQYLRPVFLIFDQFEELFIFGSDKEKNLFVKTLKALLGPSKATDCHIIIVMREEYFAWLDSFEENIPGISDRRVRIEPMRLKEIKGVILESCHQFNIKLSDPEYNIKQIINALSKKGEVTLPYLQVYLDQLWRKDFENTHSNGYTGNEKYIPLTFTTQEIEIFGEIRDVMQRFLLEQKKIFQDKFKKQFPDVQENYFNKVLDSFINDQATKTPNTYTVENKLYIFKKPASRFLIRSDKHVLKFTLEFFLGNQILRNNGNTMELGHDVLAKVIDKQRDAKQQRINGIRLMISLYKKSKDLIPYDVVKKWEGYIDQLDLKDGEKSFFLESKLAGEQQEKDERHALEIQIALEQKDKEYQNAAAQRKIRTNKLLFASSLAAIAILVFVIIEISQTLDTYYAINVVPGLDTLSNKRDAVNIAKYLYDHKPHNETKNNTIAENMMKLVQSPSFASQYSSFNLALKSTSTLLAGIDIDISGNGKFIVVKNDSIPTQNHNSLFLIYDTEQKRAIDSFSNIKYAYFLNHSDTLLLGFGDSGSTLFNSYPNKFILYNCSAKTRETFNLNFSERSGNLLYNADNLSKTNFSERDSYKIRMLNSGDLLIPYFSVSAVGSPIGRDANRRLRIQSTTNGKILDDSSDYSISTSLHSDKVLYGYKTKKGLIGKMFSTNGRLDTVFNNAGFADLTETGEVAVSLGNHLSLNDSTGVSTQRFTARAPIIKIFSGKTKDFLLAMDRDGRGYIFNLRDTSKTVTVDGQIVGYDFIKKTIITVENSGITKSKDSITLFLRDFNGMNLKKILNNYGVENLSFNSQSGTLLLKTNQLPKSNLQLLYLYDNNLTLKGSFYLTPNDAYGFSDDGKFFFFVRDNELSVFKNEAFLDLTDFKSVNAGLEALKTRDSKNYNSRTKKLRKYYGISFPTQIFW